MEALLRVGVPKARGSHQAAAQRFIRKTGRMVAPRDAGRRRYPRRSPGEPMRDFLLQVEAALAALADPRQAEEAADRLAAWLRSGAERFPPALLERIAGLHDISVSRSAGSGPLAVASLRRSARAEIDRRGGAGWRPLAPPHQGVIPCGALEGHDSELRSLTLVAPSLLLSDAVEPTRALWDLASASERARPPRDDGFGDGWWVRHGSGGRARAIDLVAHRSPLALALPAGRVAAVAGGRLALLEGSSAAAVVSVWEFASGRRLLRQEGLGWDRQGGDALELALSPRGRYLAVSAGYGTSLTLFAVDASRESATFGRVKGEADTALAALGPEPQVLLRRHDGVERIDLVSGERLRLEVQRPTAATLDPVTGRLAVGSAGSLELHTTEGSLGWRTTLAGDIDALGFDARGETLGAVVRDGWRAEERGPATSLAFWTADGQPRAHVGSGRCFVFLERSTPPFADLATGGRWGSIWLWRFAN